MHYKNGREAKEGDFVVGKTYHGGSEKVVAGVVHCLNPGAQTCNGIIVFPVVGGTSQSSITLSSLLHAEDAYVALDEKLTDPA